MASAIYSTLNECGIDINSVYIQSTGTPEYPAPSFVPGTLAWGTDGSEWVYCTASITIGAGKVCIISEVPGSWSVALIGGATVTTPLTGDLVGIMGGSNGSLVVPAPVSPQTGTYFWLQRAGIAQNVATAASTTKNAQLYSSATTGGSLSSTAGGSATTYLVNGIAITQATGSAAGPNTAVLNFPVIGATG